MGYKTSYNLSINTFNNKLSEKDIIKEFRDKYKDAFYAIDDNGFNNDSRWYEHEEDLKKFSTFYPEMIFQLDGDGEDSYDNWIKYFKDGKMQVCEVIISYEPFDENKLI